MKKSIPIIRERESEAFILGIPAHHWHKVERRDVADPNCALADADFLE